MRAEAVDAAELIVTDRRFGAARPLLEPTCRKTAPRLKPVVSSGVIPIVTGYIAASEDGVMTTLGRGGSDYSAAIIGACLDADEVWIWSDVDGILTADPNLVPGSAHTGSALLRRGRRAGALWRRSSASPHHPAARRARHPAAIIEQLQSRTPRHAHPGLPDPERQRYPAIISTLGLSMIRLSRNGDDFPLEPGQRRHAPAQPGRSRPRSAHVLAQLFREQPEPGHPPGATRPTA